MPPHQSCHGGCSFGGFRMWQVVLKPPRMNIQVLAAVFDAIALMRVCDCELSTYVTLDGNIRLGECYGYLGVRVVRQDSERH
jgi:hypothetical protein